MNEIIRLIQEVLVGANARGVRFARRSCVSGGTFERITELTHQHAWDHGAEESDTAGWRRYPGGILPWWAEEARLDLESKRRLFSFRSDVVRHLEDQGGPSAPAAGSWAAAGRCAGARSSSQGIEQLFGK